MSHLPKLARGFAGNERGNTGMIFAMCMVPMVALVGGAVDFSRANAMRTEMQAALDAAILAGAKAYQTKAGDPAAVQLAIQTSFDQTLAINGAKTLGTNGTGPTINTPVIDTTMGLISATASYNVPTTFLGLAGMSSIEINADSSISLSGKKLEVALMLDVTGSMDDYVNGVMKLDSLKLAAKDFLDIVQPDNLPLGTTKVSLVPFSQTVKVDAATAVALTGQPAQKEVQTGTNTTYSLSTTSWAWKTYSQCYAIMLDYYDIKLKHRNSTAQTEATNWCNAAVTNGQSGSSKRYKVWDIDQTDTPIMQTQYIKPCFTERKGTNGALRYSDASPATESGWTASYSSTLTENQSCAPNFQLVPLSVDKDVLKTKIDAFTPSGSTAGHLGTAFAWYTISGDFTGVWPAASQPVAYQTPNLTKAAVLMTDGLYNTDYSGGNPSSITQARALCDAMKLKNVEVFTVGFGINSDLTAQETLTYCASEPKATHFYFPYDGEELRTVFRSIGQSLAMGALGMRVSK